MKNNLNNFEHVIGASLKVDFWFGVDENYIFMKNSITIYIWSPERRWLADFLKSPTTIRKTHKSWKKWIIIAHCGSLNITDPKNLIERNTIGKHGFSGAGMTLFEEVCNCGVGFWDLLCSRWHPVSQWTSCCLLIKL